MRQLKVIATCAALALTACSHQQAEVRTGYTIWDVPANPQTDAKAFYAALKSGLEATGTKFTVSIDPPPNPLPDQPGRFTTVNPLQNSKMAALMGTGAGNFKTASCDGASFVANLANDDMNRYGENTQFVACAFPYANGFSVNVWHKFMMNKSNIGASVARSVLGDSSQFIPRTVDSVVSGLRSAGYIPTVVDSF